jgi:hypothetical protein
MAIEKTINELYAFFSVEPVDDIREFNSLELERSYLKKLNNATIPGLKEDIKDKYVRLKQHVAGLLEDYKPDNTKDIKILFDEFCDSLRVNNPVYKKVE